MLVVNSALNTDRLLSLFNEVMKSYNGSKLRCVDAKLKTAPHRCCVSFRS